MPPTFWRREMRINKPWYLAAQTIRGFEEPVVAPVVEPPAPVVEPVEEPVVEPKSDDLSGLKSALEKERTDRKAYQKKLQAYEKAQQAKDDAEKTEIERLTTQAQRDTERLQKLTMGYRSKAVEEAILAEARKAKFTDPTDALRQEVLSAIEVEQDEDDPTQVTVDSTSVINAVKALAKVKPHYLGTTQKSPSGSKFGGGQPKTELTAEQQLMAQYPALARRRG